MAHSDSEASNLKQKKKKALSQVPVKLLWLCEIQDQNTVTVHCQKPLRNKKLLARKK